MKYPGQILKEEFKVSAIFSIHYFEYNKDFAYSGEKHDFWEFVYIDKGAIGTIAGDKKHSLIKGDIIFHKPNEFHNLTANGRISPNLIIMAFSCKSTEMKWFNNRILRIGNEERNLLARILHEAGNAFSSKLNDPCLFALNRKEKQVFASEQLIKLYLEQFLIGLKRRELHIVISNEPASPLKEKTRKDAFDRAVDYFENNLIDTPNLNKVCRTTGYSCTYIQNVFNTTA